MRGEFFLTLSKLTSETGISDATISRLRGEREPIKKYNINLLSNKTNDKGVKIVTKDDLKLLIIYLIYSSIPRYKGKPKQMKDIIEELNAGLKKYDYEEIIEKIVNIFYQRIEFLEELKDSNDLNFIDLINKLKKEVFLC